ncbi:hypothetical protein HYZ97_01875 [Candidatus Pacearchaeota archaeon]|nr:hypothetical protein [Candidatus Pacearchaeota archaeon]
MIKLHSSFKPELIERVLAHLPEPYILEVRALGIINCKSIDEDFQDRLPGIEFTLEHPLLKVKEPSKELLLRIYKGRKESMPSYEELMNQTGRLTLKQLDFSKAYFLLGQDALLEFDKYSLELEYRDQEPEQVKNIRAVFAGSDFDQSIIGDGKLSKVTYTTR